MHHGTPVIRPAGAHDVTQSDVRSDGHDHVGQVRIRCPYATTVVDRYRQATGHRARKGHDPKIGGPDHGPLIGGKIDTPMATVCAVGGERPDHCPGHGRLQRASKPEDHDEKDERQEWPSPYPEKTETKRGWWYRTTRKAPSGANFFRTL